jgi:glycosyl transferase family 1
MTRLAFVSAPGSSVFMSEILEAVADEVSTAAADIDVTCQTGYLDEVVDGETVAVVVPHEYFAVAPPARPAVLARTIAFGVEHPGTVTFEASTKAAARLGSWFEIGQSSVARLRLRGHEPRLFPLGYVSGWDRWRGIEKDRSVDVAYLGTADERRLQVLAQMAPYLRGLNTEFLIPPHEPMTQARPDFLLAGEKWDLLADSKVLVNLHREGKTALEWVRVLEAIINGCVVVTEHSTDLGPLVPGEHFLVADPQDIGPVVRSVLAAPERLDQLRRAAYVLCRDSLSMSPDALTLAAEARRLASQPVNHPATTEPGSEVDDQRSPTWAESGAEPPMAAWMPTVRFPDVTPDIREPPLALQLKPATPSTPSRSTMGVICVQLPGDGPWRLTEDSLARVGRSPRLLVARTGAPTGELADPAASELSFVTETLTGHRGSERNRLLASLETDYVAVLDAGDQVLDDSLQRLGAMLDQEPGLDAVGCLARVGSAGLANVFPPELRRLEHRPYLSRGYVVRRSVLEAMGGFTEAAELSSYVDHLFWLTLERAGGRTRWLRHVGLDLWPQHVQVRSDSPVVPFGR